MIEQVEKIRKEISNRALEFCMDNHRLTRHDILEVETTMLIGASIALGQPIDPEDDGKLIDTPEGKEFLRQLFENKVPEGTGKTYPTPQ